MYMWICVCPFLVPFISNGAIFFQTVKAVLLPKTTVPFLIKPRIYQIEIKFTNYVNTNSLDLPLSKYFSLYLTNNPKL